MNKTVYFLGAGFSADAGGPIQNQIIQFILDDKFIEKIGIEYNQVSKPFFYFNNFYFRTVYF